MPALAPVAHVLMLRWGLTWSTANCGGSRIFLHYTSGPPSNSDCAALLTTVASSWTTNIKPLQHTGMALAQLNVRDLSTTTGGFAQSTPGTLGSRGAAGALVQETCVVINHSIQSTYRGGKPRTYLSAGVSVDLNGPTQWSAAFRTAVSSGWTAFIAGIVAGSSPITVDGQCSVAYYSGTTGHENTAGTRGWTTPNRLVPPVYHMVTASNARLLVGTQRRRLTAGS